mgnify:CR=1 FL=1
MACGLLLLNKPEGVRSTVCVAALRRALPGKQKVGHGGTLDSTAQGLLILLVGGATRASELVMGLQKTYDVEVRLGEERSTDDYSGEVCYSGPVPPDAGELAAGFLPSFLGTRLQVPPSVSAIHVNGVRAHTLSRSGKEPAIQPRPVRVTDIRILSGPEDTTLKLRIRCSRGTYVRSIVRDLGRRLGCGAHVSSLVRTATGLFRLADAMIFDELQRGSFSPEDRILPLSSLAAQYYGYSGEEETCRMLMAGKSAPLSAMSFLNPGISDPGKKAAVLCRDLFSFGNITASGFFEPKMNIPLEA